MSRTPISVNHGWHCVSVGSELLAKYDLREENPRHLNTSTIHSLQLSARYWAFSGLTRYTTAGLRLFFELDWRRVEGCFLPLADEETSG